MPGLGGEGATACPLVLEDPPHPASPHLSRETQVHGLRVPAAPHPAQSSSLVLSRAPGPVLLWAFISTACTGFPERAGKTDLTVHPGWKDTCVLPPS